MIVDRPTTHILPVAKPQHHVARGTIYRRHSAHASTGMIIAHCQAQNYVHLGGLSGMIDISALQNGCVVVTTRRFSLPASSTAYAGLGNPTNSGVSPTFASHAPLHATMHTNASTNSNTQASNMAYHTHLRDIRTSTPFLTSPMATLLNCAGIRLH